MPCPECDAETVTFAVPADLREHAPEGTAAAAICTRCLTVAPVDDGSSAAGGSMSADGPDLSRVHESFPAGDAGAAFALLLGTLPSVTLRKASALALRDRAEREGADVALAFDRLVDASEAGELEPAFDLARRVGQFESLAERE